MPWTAHQRAPLREPASDTQATDLAWLLSDTQANRRWSWLRWLWRNPATNLLSVIVGVADRPRWTVTTTSPWTYVPGGGWNLGWTLADGCWLPLLLISYRGRWPLGWLHRLWSYLPAEIETAAGWKTSGGLTLTFRRAYSPNAGEE